MDDVISKVKESAQYVTENAKKVKINDEDAIDLWVKEFDEQKFSSLSESTEFPLQFELRSRVNFECVKDVLEIGSGFRLPLKESSGKGAHETIITGVFSLYITHGDINAQVMASLSLLDVAEMFGIVMEREKDIEGSLKGVVTEYVDSPTKPLAVFIHKILNDCGKILMSRNCADFFELIVRELNPSPENPIEAHRLVEMLMAVFPAFKDVAEYRGREVFILKKAQLLCCDLAESVGKTHVEWKVKGLDGLTIFSDNVIPCVLRHLNILVVDESLAKHIDEGKILQTGDDEVELRMVAIQACEKMVEKMEGKISTRKLDMYLWRLGKEKEFRGKHRHYCCNTVFY